MNNENTVKTGTTTVALAGKDFVVFAADKRATAGHLIVGKSVEKVKKINKKMALTTAGSVADIQLMIKMLKAELKLKDIRNDRESKVDEAASLLANMTYSNIRKFSAIPGISHFLFGGVDSEGAKLYDIFPDGSLTDIVQEGGFVASGSGSTFAYGVLEDNYDKELNQKDAVELAIRSIHSALKRDSASGQGVDVMLIDKEGARKVEEKKLSEELS